METLQVKACILAATHSGCGKTSVCAGLLGALQKQGLTVQAGKIGPDSVDAQIHSMASGRPSVTLDAWMCGAEALKTIAGRALALSGSSVTAAQPAPLPDIFIVEGVMGLHDGASPVTEEASTAAVSKALGLPIVLLVDASSLARSVAALVKGYTEFDPALQFLGVLCNNVGSAQHAALLQESLAKYCPHIPLLGCLPRNASLTLPQEDTAQQTLQDLAHWVAQACDVTALVEKMPAWHFPRPQEKRVSKAVVRIGIAKDAAFNSMYQENIYLLQEAGAELVFFSPLEDTGLPDTLDAIWLSGAKTEEYAAKLAKNVSVRHGIREFAAQGGLVYGEGGGLLYLMHSITEAQGQMHLTAGCLPLHALISSKRQALGYRTATTQGQSLFGPAGTILRGHEFHSSRCTGLEAFTPLFAVQDSRGESLPHSGLHAGCIGATGRVMGSSLHIHLASNPKAADAFVAACRSS